MGTVVIGKVESGKCQKGDLLLVMPNRVRLLQHFIRSLLIFYDLSLFYNIYAGNTDSGSGSRTVKMSSIKEKCEISS